MKAKIVQIVLLAVSGFLGWQIYESIDAPIKFEKEKEARFEAVIRKLKDIRLAQDAHLNVKGDFAKDYNALVDFIENEKFTITTQRDTSWTEYDKIYKITVQKQGVVIDTLGFVPVKDSLFRGSERYKEMNQLAFKGANCAINFEMKTASLEKNNYIVPVYEVKVSKKEVLCDLDKEEVSKELEKKGVNDVKGAYISVGSLQEVSNNGNWPTKYDAKINKTDKK